MCGQKGLEVWSGSVYRCAQKVCTAVVRKCIEA